MYRLWTQTVSQKPREKNKMAKVLKRDKTKQFKELNHPKVQVKTY